ncbi:MAG: O-antigen ligase family protein [Steroidobacteraceae bacterium]
MPIYIKEVIVVLAIAIPLFALGKPIALNFTAESDFKRRRNVWIYLTVVAFLSPSFWTFVLLGAPALFWAGKKDSNPLALYLLLMNVIPSIAIDIPTGNLGFQLFYLDIFRLLSFCVLVPAAWRLYKSEDPNRGGGLRKMDLLLIGFGILQVVEYVRPDLKSHVILQNSPTNMVRDALLFFIDMYVIYYVASRSCQSRRAMLDALAMFCLSCALMAAAAVFESVKHWLLYTNLFFRWGGKPIEEAYLFRAGLLRAEASSANAIMLGYLLAIALGIWLYLKSHLETRGPRIVAVTVLLWLGLFASFSRGPWLGAILIYLAYAAFGPRGTSRLVKSVFIFLIVGGLVLVSPIGHRILEGFPTQGATSSSLTYRERLADRSWQLIQAHPLLGDQFALSKMQGLRQGQGIIDIVNTYVGVTLFHGFIGLALFLGFILLALSKARRAAREARQSDPDLALLAASLAACIVGNLFMLADFGFFLGCVPTFFTLAGFAVTCSRFTHQTSVVTGVPPVPSSELL